MLPLSNPLQNWHVSKGALRITDGRALLLRGVNIASAHKQPPYFGFHGSADFRRVRDEWGMNAVRLLISWAAIEPERDCYDIGYLDRLSERLDWARDARLWVVLDMHQDVYGEAFGGNGAPRWTCNPESYAGFEPSDPWFLNYLKPEVAAAFNRFWTDLELQDKYFGAWCQLAARFADHPAVVGFDPMNEPFWGTIEVTQFENQVLHSFYERAVRAVRRLAPRWVAFIEPCSSRNLGIRTQLRPFSFDNVVYAPHCYDLSAEAGHGFDPVRRSTLIENIAQLSKEAQQLGTALWIGEYGGNADHPGISEYMDAHFEGAGRVAAGSMYWAYDRDAGYGLLDPNGNEKPELLAALVRPYPELINGDPITLSFDATTREFRCTWLSGDPEAGPSEISVPRRVYPTGYRASAEGHESLDMDTRPNRLLLRGVPAGAQITLRITATV